MTGEPAAGSTRNLVDPELLPLLDFLSIEEFSDARLGDIRTQVGALVPPLAPPPPGVTRREMQAPGLDGGPDVRVLVYAPEAAGADRPAVLHIHGGGYVMGSPEGSDPKNAALAVALGAVVVSVDYRLAPEHPFPAPLDDCYAALRWLHDGAATLGVEAARIAVAGESAGGGLAATLAQRARDAGIALALQALGAPMLDDRTAAEGGAPTGLAGEFIWTPPHNRYGWGAYLRGADPSAPYAAGARMENLRGLAPAFVYCGALDLFLQEDLAYAARLVAAGVPTEVHVHPGAVHAFELVAPSRIATTVAAEQLDALRRALG